MNSLTAYTHSPAHFIDDFIQRDEKGRPFRLAEHQRRVLAKAFQWERNASDEIDRLLLRLLLWGEMKKSGKTFLAACLALWWGFIVPNTEIIIVANDLEQSIGRVFKTVVQILKANSALMKSAKIQSADIALSNGTTITAISSDYKGAAGSRHSLVVYDELWGFSLERSERLFEELTVPPTESNAWVLVVTYAGWSGESVVLERLYQRGLTGQRIDHELELYQHDDLVMFWSHTPRQPWQTAQYYAEQRRMLRPNTFARLHENRWVTNESAFITADLWDACVSPAHHPLLPDPTRQDYAAVDIGIKSDCTGIAIVTEQNGQVVQVAHRIWKPTATEPLNLEHVEAFILDWHGRGRVRWLADPYQAHHLIMRMKAAGVSIEEFPQTVQNTVRMGQGLFDLLNARAIRLYPDEDVRQQALNAIAVENPRGFRLAKEKASRKIDVIVALSMACVAATASMGRPVLRLLNPDDPHRVKTVDELEKGTAEWEAAARAASVATIREACSQTGYWWPS